MVAELIALGVFAVVLIGELVHAIRCRRLAPLAYGPSGRPRVWALLAPWMRVLAATALAWGLTTLLTVKPKVHRAEEVNEDEYRHVMLVLDVSPSMRLDDAGPAKDLSRMKRVNQIMNSFFERVVIEQVRLSVIAVYTGAKPVVIDTKDVDVVRNLFEMPLFNAFDTGKTELMEGIELAAEIVRPWRKNSTTIVILSDGDTVPPTGMPKMPPSVSDVLVVGVGDPRTGKFIDGHQSRQDVTTLRQIANRLGGTFHNGNEKHIQSDTLDAMTQITSPEGEGGLSRREWALIASTVGGLLLLGIPLALTAFGSPWSFAGKRRR